MIDPRVRPAPPIVDADVRALAELVCARTARVRREELAWLADAPGGDARDPALLARSLTDSARVAVADRSRFQDRGDALRAGVRGLGGLALREALARHLRVTVDDPRALRADLAALDRWLDVDALLEREALEIEREGARLEVAVEALGGLAPTVPGAAWAEAGAEELLVSLAAREPRPATRRAVVRALARAVGARASSEVARDLASDAGLATLRERLLDGGEDVLVRRAALDVVEHLPAPMALAWLGAALDLTATADDALVRARAAEVACATPERWPALVDRVLADPADVVAAAAVDGLLGVVAAGEKRALAVLQRVLGADPRPVVRARVADGLRVAGAAGAEAVVPALDDVPLVAAYACSTIREVALGGVLLSEDARHALLALVARAGPELARSALAASAAVGLGRSVLAPVAVELGRLEPGESRRVDLPEPLDALDLGRALASFAVDGFGYAVEPVRGGARVVRGEAPVPRLWRVLHELRHPSPSKRQGHTHAVGRADQGRIRVPPGGLAEESATGVPGERLRIPREGGWAPAVPMVDDLLDATRRGEVWIATPEGVTRVRAPKGLAAWKARWKLTVRYARFDSLRSQALADPEPAQRRRYVDALRDLGFEIALDPPDGLLPEAPPIGPSLAVFGASLAPLGWLVEQGKLTALHLAVVVMLLSVVLFGRAAVAARTVAWARAQLPLVVGGWGTRGKSGTERLKAGLLEGLGLPMLSKTTGCEAMVLHGPPGGHALELFLFRPFDKATIWEQVKVIRLAARLGARAMLWECMGLNPAYVRMLQDRWMRDDVSTLTNAYPDHEDIQGPTGMDVATVLGGFAPREALVFSTEANMLPVLAMQARRKGCAMEPVRRGAWELIPKELLARLPHAEHPANVSLACAVAGALGVDRTEAAVLMARHVVPDLGALVVYPRARHLGRDVVFSNGMSANDTLSFRHNWRHLGFLDHDVDAKPDEWLITVVNNRADRVARSRVFAAILANDANAHAHVLIGTNLSGLVQYLDEAVEEKLAATVLSGQASQVDALFAHLRLVAPGPLGAAAARRLGGDPAAWVAATDGWGEGCPAELDGARRFAASLRPAAAALEAACGPDAAGLADALVEVAAKWASARAARTAPADSARALYRALVRASVTVIEDSGSSGDATMATAITRAPPGCLARVMGVQNIKGTGLDFAYQWVYWRELHGALRELGDPARRRAALDTIERNPLGSALACEAAIEALEPWVADAAVGPRVAALRARIVARREALLAARSAGRKVRGRFGAAARLVERLVDPIDAVRRSRGAAQVFDDLAMMRISHHRAQAELQRLTERQKGGWLA